MASEVEELYEKKMQNDKKKIIENMLELGTIPVEEIARMTSTPVEYVQEVAGGMTTITSADVLTSCPVCGTEIKSEDQVCPTCGTPQVRHVSLVKPEPAPAPAAASTVTAAGSSAVSSAIQNTGKNPAGVPVEEKLFSDNTDSSNSKSYRYQPDTGVKTSFNWRSDDEKKETNQSITYRSTANVKAMKSEDSSSSRYGYDGLDFRFSVKAVVGMVLGIHGILFGIIGCIPLAGAGYMILAYILGIVALALGASAGSWPNIKNPGHRSAAKTLGVITLIIATIGLIITVASCNELTSGYSSYY